MVAKMHRVHIPEVGEASVLIPAGTPYKTDDVQQFPLGSVLRLGLKTFVYSKSGGITNTDLGIKNLLTQCVAYTTVAAAALINATEIVIDVAASDGPAADGVIAKDYLVGGEVVVFPHDSNTFTRTIMGNTAVATGEMTLTLDSPIPVALDGGDVDHGECMASPYASVGTATGNTSSVMGIATCLAASGKYLWLQTGGPVWIAPQGEVSVGNNNREVVFRHDGSIDEYDASDANTIKAQHAGFVIANAAGGGQGAAFIMLQILN